MEEIIEIKTYNIEILEKIKRVVDKNCRTNYPAGYRIRFQKTLGPYAEYSCSEAKDLKDVVKEISKQIEVPTWKSELRSKLIRLVYRIFKWKYS